MWVDQVDGVLSPEGVQAIAALAALVVGVVAAAIALAQVKQARYLREEQARPYVVVYVERARASSVDLVVKNFGATAARQVRLTWDREPVAYWNGKVEPMKYFDEIPVLVPGQEWRTVWDFRGRRIEAGESAYHVTVHALDSRLRSLPQDCFEISTRQFADEMRLERKGPHEIGIAIEKLEKTTRGWSEGIRELRVFLREASDEKQRSRTQGIEGITDYQNHGG